MNSLSQNSAFYSDSKNLNCICFMMLHKLSSLLLLYCLLMIYVPCLAHIKIKINSTRHSDFVENRCEMCQTSPEVLPVITLWHHSVKTDLKFFI